MASSGNPLVAIVDCAPDDEPFLSELRAKAATRISYGAPAPDEIAERARGAAVLATLYTYTRVDGAVLSRLPTLRLVATRTSGYSHIDAEAARGRGVAVATVPAASIQAVAEYVFGAVLAAQRRLVQARDAVRGGAWRYHDFRGFELAGATLGVIGLGMIGTRVAELGHALGMHVLAWSRTPRELAGVELAELMQVMARADIVSVNLALTGETRGLIGERELAQLKKSAWLVNTARGGIVDEDALFASLESGRLGGAVLDVLAEEPPSAERLERMSTVPNLLVTPHIAWNTEQAIRRQFDELTENVLAFLEGRPRNLIE